MLQFPYIALKYLYTVLFSRRLGDGRTEPTRGESRAETVPHHLPLITFEVQQSFRLLRMHLKLKLELHLEKFTK